MRRRYVQQPDGTLLEVGVDYVQPVAGDDGYVITDAWLEGTRSPIDGSMIDTRAKMRSHMQLHGVAHQDEIQPDVDRARAEINAKANTQRVYDIIEAYRQARTAGYRPRRQ